MNKTDKKLVSLLLTLVLMMSCVTGIVLAAEGENRQGVIGSYHELDENGNIIEGSATDDPVTTITDDETNNYLSYSKVVTESDIANEYDITFTVETTEKLNEIELSDSADVVLIFDVSTSMDYKVDGTRPGNEGWELDSTRWAAMKEAAKVFIEGLLGNSAESKHRVSIVAYGGMASSRNTTIAHRTICDWTGDAQAAVNTFYDYDVVCQSYATETYGVTNTTSLRKHYFGDNGNNYANTNCEAGFQGAIEKLDELEKENNQFVVYMSDGEANVSYTQANYITNGVGTTYGPIQDAINMAGKLKENYPKAALYTVGFGDASNSAVLQKGDGDDGNNVYVDRYYAADSADDLKAIYEELYALIEMLSHSWQVDDPMGSMVTLDPASIEGTGSYTVSEDGQSLNWDLLGSQHSGTRVDDHGRTVYIYTLTYTVKLDITGEGFDWATYYSTNGITSITYVFTYENGSIAKESSGTGYFKVPSVKGKMIEVTYKSNGGTGDDVTENLGWYIDHTVRTADSVGFTRSGYKLDSWNTSEDGSGTSYRPNDVIEDISENVTLYAQWIIELRGDHVAYIIGYEDKTVKPENNITRAEVATIFFRLLSDDARDNYWQTSNTFTDVSAKEWYNNAVSTMSNAQIINGYTDNTFGGDKNITRAEFATIAARFDSTTYEGPDKFTDVEEHWAVEYINRAAERGWIQGYEDGTFKPDKEITRAEAITLINRVLGRDKISAEDMLEGMATWSDNMKEDEWYYEAVQEATNSHEFYGREDGTEYWTKLVENPDWSTLEKEWAGSN